MRDERVLVVNLVRWHLPLGGVGISAESPGLLLFVDYGLVERRT